MTTDNAQPARGRFRGKTRPPRELAVAYRVAGGELVAARTKNIGVGGAFILTDVPLRAGSVLTVQLDAPDGALELAAEVRWAVAVESDDHEAGMGVEFVTMGAEEQRRLAECFAR